MLVHGCGFQILLSFVCFLRSSSWKVSKVPGIPFFLCGFLQKEAPEDKCICRSSWSNSPSAQNSISHSSADVSTSHQYCLHVWRLEIVRMVPVLELVSLKRLILLFVISMPCVHVCFMYVHFPSMTTEGSLGVGVTGSWELLSMDAKNELSSPARAASTGNYWETSL